MTPPTKADALAATKQLTPEGKAFALGWLSEHIDPQILLDAVAHAAAYDPARLIRARREQERVA